MTFKELKQHVENKKKAKAAQYNAEKLGHDILSFTDKEFNQSMKMTQKFGKTGKSRNNGYYKPTFATNLK